MPTAYTLGELDDYLAAADALPTEDSRRLAWATLVVDHGMFAGFPAELAALDPFAPAYAAKVGEFMRFLFGRDYEIASEGTKPEIATWLHRGFPYSTRSASTVGCYLISYGFVIREMNLPVPSRILEIGCGTGALSIHLAATGYDLTAVDVNPVYAEHVRSLCAGAPGKVDTITADMNALELPADYDAVLFYESFHHSHDHPATIAKALTFLKPGGILVLAAEPIVARPIRILPYPWGPRLDGETLRAIRRFGWMELGFTQDYLYELMRRNGLAFRRASSPETHWADLVVASRAL